MSNEKNAIITYQGIQINLFSDDRADYVSLTDIYKAHGKYSKSINAWLKTRQTLDFLSVWEKKNNPKFKATHLSQAIKLARERNGLSAQAWIELTDSIGIFARGGAGAGTYAHKDIAIKFAAWLSPEFELYLVEEIQRLREIEQKKNSFELLTHQQVLYLIQLKEVFKYVVHQEAIEDAHKDVFASKSSAKNPFAEFQVWRNKILDISVVTINERIKQYCIDNQIALTKTLLNKTKREKLLLLDNYESVKIAVWDFLNIKGEVNALNLATLVGDMIRTEKGEVLRTNEDSLFNKKQSLGQFSNFLQDVNKMKEVKTAREILALNSSKNNTPKTKLDAQLKGILAVGKPPKEDK